MKRLVVLLMASLVEADVDRAPLGPMYAALLGVVDYDTFMKALDIIVEMKWATKTSETITLTQRGKELGLEWSQGLIEKTNV